MIVSTPSTYHDNAPISIRSTVHWVFLFFIAWTYIYSTPVARASNGTSSSPTDPPCTVMFSLKTGLWTDQTTWSCHRLPTSGDDVIISPEHVVTIPVGTTAVANTVTQQGKLVFAASDAVLKLGFSVDKDLVAYYPFNGNANDESGNNHPGTVNGATLATDRFGISNQAYSFDGNNWIKVDQKEDLQLHDFTFSAWVNLSSNSSLTNMILANPANESEQDAWHYGFTAGGTLLEAYTFTGNYIYNSVSPTAIINNWHQVVYVKSGTTVTILLDGVKLGSHTVPDKPTYNNPRGVLIGADDDYELDGVADRWFFNGKLDDIRIYSRGLTEAEVHRLYEIEAPANITDGLLAYYPFNGNATDESGNSHNGTVNGATLATDRFGIPDKAYEFNGNNWIKVEAATNLQPNEFTLSAWVNLYPNSYEPNMIIANPMGTVEEDSWHFDLRNYGSALNGYIYQNNYILGNLSQSIFNTWHHVAYTKSGTTAKLFLDGTMISSQQFPSLTTLRPYNWTTLLNNEVVS